MCMPAKMNGHQVIAVREESSRWSLLSEMKQIMSVLWSPKWVARVGVQMMDEVIPGVCIALGMVWLAYILLCSSATPGVLLCILGISLWLRRECRVLRDRGGPIALLPPWARNLLLETRPLDAMSAVAVVIDAQKGIGMMVHLLAALRLDSTERSGFAEQLPPRIRDLVLAPGLLHVLPKSVRNCMTWKNQQKELQVIPKPKRKLTEEADQGDAPRASDLLLFTEDLVNRAHRSNSASNRKPGSGSSKRRKTRMLTTPQVQCNQQQFFPAPDDSDDDETQQHNIVSRNHWWWSSQGSKKRTSRMSSTSAQKSSSTSVARVVAEFNPWPTLFRIVQRRATLWLRQQISVRALASTAAASAACMGLQLVTSPASRRIAANSARFTAIITATSAFVASALSFLTLHLGPILDDFAVSKTFSPRNAKSKHRTAARARLLSLRSQRTFSEVEDDDVNNIGTPPLNNSPPLSEKKRSPSSRTTTLSLVCGSFLLFRACEHAALFSYLSPFAAQLAKRISQAALSLRSGGPITTP